MQRERRVKENEGRRDLNNDGPTQSRELFRVRPISVNHLRNGLLILAPVSKSPDEINKVPNGVLKGSQACRINFNMVYPLQLIFNGHKSSKPFIAPVGLGEESSSLSKGEKQRDANDSVPDPSFEEGLSSKISSNNLKALMLDTERTKLLKKPSEANQYNRFLRRQLLIEEDALTKYKNELAVLELELQVLIGLAEEIAKSEVPLDSRKINGKYIQTHLLARLAVVHEKVKDQIKDVDSSKFQEVNLSWVGMAEIVLVMGSFDGWTQGEGMSPEYSGDFARFSTLLKLRPGRYEIKFVVDGEWQLSPDLPTVGEGPMQNNLLVVKKAN